MDLKQCLNQASTLIAVLILSAPVAADHIKLSTVISTTPAPTVAAIAASLYNTLAVMIPRPTTPADSGILFSLSRSDQADFTVSQSRTEIGHSEITGGNSSGDTGASLGYRKTLSNRWSLDMQFERQGVAKQKANTLSEVIAHWASMAAMYHTSITPKLSVHAGSGAFFWQRERATSIGEVMTAGEETGANLMLQVGLGYRVIPRVTIEGNVQRFYMPDKAIDKVSLGVVVRTD